MRKKGITMNQSGQAFEAYRVLIAMVLALAVLLIIVSTITYFDKLREKVSLETLYSSWKSAVDAPNGKVILARDLFFPAGTRFSRSQFSKQVSLDESCLQFDAEKATGFTLNDSDVEHPYVNVASSVGGNVYMQCYSNNDNGIVSDPIGSCYAYCLLSFGKLVVGPGG
jgi:hypothetical protein